MTAAMVGSHTPDRGYKGSNVGKNKVMSQVTESKKHRIACEQISNNGNQSYSPAVTLGFIETQT